MAISADIEQNNELLLAFNNIEVLLDKQIPALRDTMNASLFYDPIGNRSRSMNVLRDTFAQAGTYSSNDIRDAWNSKTGKVDNTIDGALASAVTEIDQYYTELLTYMPDVLAGTTAVGSAIVSGSLTTVQRDALLLLLDDIEAVFA